MGDLRMPSLGSDMEEGTLLEWTVTPGTAVRRGDTVAVVDTDKAAIEIECFEDGVMGEQLVAPGAKVPVGTPIARISGAAAGVPAPRAAPAPAAPAPPVPGPPAPAPAPLRRRSG